LVDLGIVTFQRNRKSKKPPKELSVEEAKQRERSYVLWLLARRDYSRKKLEQKLRDRGNTPEQIAELLDRLIEAQIFQPKAFLRTRTRSLARKGYSPSAISWKLREDGVKESPAQVGELLEDQGVAADEGLKALVAKARRKLSTSEIPQAFVRRCLGRGHRYADIVKAWKESVHES
jgi:SOS response regulatory protein OraA/RecX